MLDASYTVQETREDGTFSDAYNAFWEKTAYRKLMSDNHSFNKFDARRKSKPGRILEFTDVPNLDCDEHINDESIIGLFDWDGLDAA